MDAAVFPARVTDELPARHAAAASLEKGSGRGIHVVMTRRGSGGFRCRMSGAIDSAFKFFCLCLGFSTQLNDLDRD